MSWDDVFNTVDFDDDQPPADTSVEIALPTLDQPTFHNDAGTFSVVNIEAVPYEPSERERQRLADDAIAELKRVRRQGTFVRRSFAASGALRRFIKTGAAPPKMPRSTWHRWLNLDSTGETLPPAPGAAWACVFAKQWSQRGDVFEKLNGDSRGHRVVRIDLSQ